MAMQSTDPLPQVVDPTSQWSLADLLGCMIRTCFPRFYIDVLHPKRPLLEVHRYEVEVAQAIPSWRTASWLSTSSTIILIGFGMDWKDA